MRIRMITNARGPGIRYRPGDEIDLPLETASAMISGGYAVPLEPFPKKGISCLETAAADPAPEKAVRPSAKAKKR